MNVIIRWNKKLVRWEVVWLFEAKYEQPPQLSSHKFWRRWATVEYIARPNSNPDLGF